MGLFDTLKNALGLSRPIRVEPLRDLELTASAKNELARMRADEGLRVSMTESGDEYAVRIDVVAISELPERNRVWVENADRLKGTRIDWDGDRFRLVSSLQLKALPTPNPDGRLYVSNRPWVRGRPQFFQQRTDETPPLARRLLGIDDVTSVLVREHTITVQRTNEASWDRVDRDVGDQLREYLLRGGQALPPRAASPADDDLLRRAREMLGEEVAPMVHADGGDLELVDIVDGIAQVRMTGACSGCPASELTLRGAIQQALTRGFPGEILGVEAV